MRLQKLFAITTAFSMLLLAAPPVKPPPTLTYQCLAGVDPVTGACYEGQVQYTAANLPRAVDVWVDGALEGAYVARMGNLVFIQDFALQPGNHTVEIYDGGGRNAGQWLAGVTVSVVSLP